MDCETLSDAVTLDGGNDRILAGRYRILKQLGAGGMGSVWLAEDTALDNKRFAIKMLPSVLVSNKRAYRQLKDEALVAMKLTHQNIVTLRAFEENDGNPFLVLDYVDGQTLDDYLAEKGKLSGDETARLLKPIAAALDYAHSKGVAHRDVKPGNVMVAKDGTPYILDFGIAREIQETMTRVTGKLSSGTLLYMSPEQLRGQSPNAAQDIYSFAAMVYQCLAGKPPFSRGDITHQILDNPPPPLPPGCSGRLGAAVMAGLDKNPAKRPLSCTNLLRGIITGDKKPRRLLNNMLPRPSKKRILPFFITGVLVSLIAGGVYYGFSRRWNVVPKHGDTKTITLPGGATMEMIYVAPGSFTMGSLESEDGRYNETQHRVTLTKGFWLGKYEVTQKQWKSVMGNNPSEFKGDDLPVECVSWDDCQEFIRKVNASLNCGARLPTEAEWEYACRAGTSGPYAGARLPTEAEWEYACRARTSGPYAGGSLDSMAWYYDNSGFKTHPVGQKSSNVWGFYDMHGNVWEWCDDWYGDYPSRSVKDPKGASSGAYRVDRGGGWIDDARDCRSAYRDRCSPGIRYNCLGFRVALAPSH